VLSQPARQIVGACEIQQRFGQGLQLLQRQGLNTGSDCLAQGAAAAFEQAKGDGGFSERTATGLALGLA